MKKATRPAIFKWRQTESELILCAVRWYLRYSLSLRDVEELLSERGLEADWLPMLGELFSPVVVAVGSSPGKSHHGSI